MYEEKDIPEDLLGFLEELEGFEKELEDESRRRNTKLTGEQVSEIFLRRSGGGDLTNVIPGGKPGKCHKVLRIFIVPPELY